MPLAAFQILRNSMVPRLSLRCSVIPRRPPVPTHKKSRDTKVPRPIYRLDTINSSIYLFKNDLQTCLSIVQKAERLFSTMKSDQLLQIFKSSLCLSLILSKQSCSLLRILTFQRVVTNLTVKECLIFFHAWSLGIK